LHQEPSQNLEGKDEAIQRYGHDEITFVKMCKDCTQRKVLLHTFLSVSSSFSVWEGVPSICLNKVLNAKNAKSTVTVGKTSKANQHMSAFMDW